MGKTFEAATTRTLKDYRGTINAAVNSVHANYGGDKEEMRNEALLIYMKAYLSHDADKARFSTWLYFKVYKGLLELAIKRAKEQTRLARHHLDFEVSEVTYGGERWLELWDSLSDNAKAVVALVFDTPHRVARDAEKSGKVNPKSYRSALRAYLMRAKWPAEIVAETFKEIREALR